MNSMSGAAPATQVRRGPVHHCRAVVPPCPLESYSRLSRQARKQRKQVTRTTGRKVRKVTHFRKNQQMLQLVSGLCAKASYPSAPVSPRQTQVLHFAFQGVRGAILDTPRYGVWSFCHTARAPRPAALPGLGNLPAARDRGRVPAAHQRAHWPRRAEKKVLPHQASQLAGHR